MVRENTPEYRILKDLLTKNEVVAVEVVERRIGGGRWLAPAHAYATNKNVIIIRHYATGLRRSIKVIKYDHITEIRVEKGVLFCRVHFSLIGEQSEKEENLKWITGLMYRDALELIRYINKIQEKPVEGLSG